MGFNCLKAAEPLQRNKLLFTAKFLEIPFTHLINLGGMNGRVYLGPPICFEHGTLELEIQRLKSFRNILRKTGLQACKFTKRSFNTGVFL